MADDFKKYKAREFISDDEGIVVSAEQGAHRWRTPTENPTIERRYVDASITWVSTTSRSVPFGFGARDHKSLHDALGKVETLIHVLTELQTFLRESKDFLPAEEIPEL